VLRFALARSRGRERSHHQPKPLCVPAPLLITAMDRRPSSIAAAGGEWRPPLLAAPPVRPPSGGCGLRGFAGRWEFVPTALLFLGFFWSPFSKMFMRIVRSIYLGSSSVFFLPWFFLLRFCFLHLLPVTHCPKNTTPSDQVRLRGSYATAGSLW
jgi:hypothetical protein